MRKSLFPLLLLLAASSCTTTRIVEREVRSHDTLRIIQRDTLRELRTLRDSIFQHDSIYLEGETRVKLRYRYRERQQRDTIYRTRVDTVRIAQHLHSRQKEEVQKGRLPLWLRVFAVLLLFQAILIFIFRKVKL